MEMPSPFRHHSPRSTPNCLRQLKLCPIKSVGYVILACDIIFLHSCLKIGRSNFIGTPLPD
jgi:hypothetical protein